MNWPTSVIESVASAVSGVGEGETIGVVADAAATARSMTVTEDTGVAGTDPFPRHAEARIGAIVIDMSPTTAVAVVVAARPPALPRQAPGTRHRAHGLGRLRVVEAVAGVPAPRPGERARRGGLRPDSETAGSARGRETRAPREHPAGATAVGTLRRRRARVDQMSADPARRLPRDAGIPTRKAVQDPRAGAAAMGGRAGLDPRPAHAHPVAVAVAAPDARKVPGNLSAEARHWSGTADCGAQLRAAGAEAGAAVDRRPSRASVPSPPVPITNQLIFRKMKTEHAAHRHTTRRRPQQPERFVLLHRASSSISCLCHALG